MDLVEWHVVDLHARPDLQDRLLAGDLRDSHCPECDVVIQRSEPLGVILEVAAISLVAVAIDPGEALDREPSWYQQLGGYMQGNTAVAVVPWSCLPALLERDVAADVQQRRSALDQVSRAHGRVAAAGYDDVLSAVRDTLRDIRLGDISIALGTAEHAAAFLQQWESLSGSVRRELKSWLAGRPPDVRTAMILQLVSEAMTDPGAAFAGHRERMRGLGTALGEEVDEAVRSLTTLRDRRDFDGVLRSVPAALERAEAIGDDASIAFVLEQKAYALLHRGSSTRADDVEGAIAAYEAVVGLDDSDAGRLQNLATALGERIYGDPAANRARSEHLLRRALDLSRHDSDERALISTNLAVLIGKRPDGTEHASERRQLCAEALQHRSPERNVTDWAYSMVNLGTALGDEGDQQAAREIYEAVLERENELTDPWVASFARLNLALAIDDEHAIDVLKRGIAVESQPALRGRLLTRLGNVLERLGRVAAAADAYGRVLTALDPQQAPLECEDAALHLAHLRIDAGDWDGAATAYDWAVRAADVLIAGPWARTDREEEMKRRAWVTRWASFALLRAGRIEDSLVVLENGRTRELRLRLGVEDPDVARIEQLAPELAAELRSASELLAQQDSGGGSRLADALTAIRRLPGLARFGRGTTLERIAQAAAPAQPLIYINPTPWGTAAIAVDATGVVHTELWPVTGKEIAFRLMFAADADAFDLDEAHDALVAGGEADLHPQHPSLIVEAAAASSDRLEQALDATLPWLTERIGEPLRRLLDSRDASGAVVIACGPLASAPIAALGLLDRAAITQAPSASLQVAARNRLTSLNPTRLVAIADPTDDLEAARAEAHAIGERFEKDSVTLLEGPAATSTALIAAAAGASHLHLACHARGGMVDYRDAGVRLADRLLSLEEVGQLPLSGCELAVASACQTAMPGVSELGDEALSVGTFLLVAGATCSIASLWSVDDLATGLLMTRFYDELDQAPPAQALQRAQRWLRDADLASEAEFVAGHSHLEPLYRARVARRARANEHDPADLLGHPYAHPAARAGFVVMGASWDVRLPRPGLA